ncbi:MAG: ribosome assembly RNA-binding protein YhbY [Peptoniphilaceae bacterium]|nr:ribosome assembly RNA-binding protein YhbY [Peptoniphilaceae bacterium]MDY6019595.1 ribosome assembly RNA-binding protein YhbY [Anaerococcus sp.]
MLTGKDRAKLKKIAHKENPIFNIGKNSVTDELVGAIEEALEKKELIKIKILNNNLDDPDYIIETLLEKLNAEFVSHIGNIITIYRQSKEKKIVL